MPSPSSTVIGFFDEIVSFFFPLASSTRIDVFAVSPSVVPG